MLQCPHCHFALEERMHEGVEIDVCGECGGVWLDPGELETISNGNDFVPHGEAMDTLADLRCPRCDTQHFVSYPMEEGDLGRCGDCHGIFVDGPTIERVVSIRRPKSSDRTTRKVLGRALDAENFASLLWSITKGL